MSNSEKFKHNRDLLESQQRAFTKGGVLLKNLFSISAKHPYISIFFALSFGALVNAIYDLISYPLVSEDASLEGILTRGTLSVLFLLVCILSLLRLKSLHANMFIYEPLSQKKLLITLVSKGRHDFKDTASYVTYESLLYTPNGQAGVNNLHKVILVTTELAEVSVSANQLKQHIENSGREVELYSIAINDRSLVEIQNQFKLLFEKVESLHPAHDVIADYTGGTKDMSIALLKESEKRLITPVYLKAATHGDYSRG